MKKALTLMLALCLLLSSMPVFAEETVTGTWYLVVVGLTAGSFELNEDGTFVLATSAEGEAMNREGTWTQEGNKIALTIDNQTLSLTHDGANLLLNVEDMAALGLDQSAIVGSDVDASKFASLIQISREAGKITVAELNAYQADGTLPEGKTKEDMDAALAEMMATILSLMGIPGNSVGE